MASISIRNLPDEIHRALRVRAAQHGRSTEAEVREIIAQAVKPPERAPIGDRMAALWGPVGLTDQEREVLESVRSRTPHEPMTFE